MNLKLHKPANPIFGSLKLPGSKSISNRVLIIKALSELNIQINLVRKGDMGIEEIGRF